jgi:methylated-DNA-[protein]-cysteine S-methyltransferase
MHLHTATLPTPAGPFTLLVDDDGVCAAGFTSRVEALQRHLDPSRRTARTRATTDPGGVSTAMLAYLAGDLEALDGITVTQPGDPRQQAAWQALRLVPAGQTIGYRRLGELAELADPATDPFGAQAAGAACARNKVAVVVPCHRVLRSDGRLGGYAWGLPRKRWLLGHESALPTVATLPGVDATAVAGSRAVG